MFRTQKTFYSVPYPPHVPAKAFACICLAIFYILYESGPCSRQIRYSVAQKDWTQVPKSAFFTSKGIDDRNEVVLHKRPKLLCMLRWFYIKYIKIRSSFSILNGFFI